MKIHTALLLFILLITHTTCFSQKEIVLNDVTVSRKSIKARNVQGATFSFNPLLLAANLSIETNLSYFHENTLGSTWTLYKSIGVSNSMYKAEQLYLAGNLLGGAEKHFYNLSLQADIEPRWYFTLRNRYFNHKQTLNNSGFYLSLPLTIYTNLLDRFQVKSQTNGQTPLQHFSIKTYIAPTIGYRYTVNANLFLS